MYQLGDRVVYGIHGVCVIADMEERTVDRKKVSYFVLEPLDQPGSRYYVPSQNPVALGKLRPVLSREEMDALQNSAEVRMDAWIPDENQRKLRYRELISSGDRSALLCMVGTLYRHKNTLVDQGKKFHLCDDNFLRDAEKLLTSEISLVFDIEPAQVCAYLRKILQ